MLAILLLLFIILVLVLSIPAVQTKLGKYATKHINEEFKTNITIAKVGLQFNGDVELKGIYIEDYKKDTLVSIIELNTSIISFRKLYNSKLNFGDIDIEGMVFNLKTYKDADSTNLDIFVAKFDDNNPRTGPSEFLFSSSDISIEDGVFKLSDENKESSEILNFKDMYINATNFLIKGPDVSARINTLQFKDSRGLALKNLMADFKYTLSHMSFENLNIKTKASTLKGNLRFDYAREDLKDFTDKVKVKANFKDSEVQLDELNTFYNEFGKRQKANFDVELSGTLNDLNADKLKLSTSRNTEIRGDINFKNLFNSEADNFVMEGDFKKLSSNYKDLTALLPNVLGASIPSIFSKVGNFKMEGKSRVTSTQIDANMDIDTDIGFASTDLKMDKVNAIDDASYVGNIILLDFDLGQLIDDPKVKTTSLNLDVDGKGFKLKDLETHIEGDVFHLEYNDYKYTGIKVSGDLGNYIFNGVLKAEDPNLILDFDGLADLSQDIRKFDFNANVGYANLNALNFVVRDSISEFKGRVSMTVNGSSLDNLDGTINVKNTTYKNQDNRYIFKDFAIVSSFRGEERTIAINSPDIIEGKVKGHFRVRDVLKLTENALGSLYTNYQPHDLEEGQYLDFDFKIYNQIAEVFYKDLDIGKNTFVKGRIETDEKRFKLKFRSPRITYQDYFANDLRIDIDNSNPVYNTFIESDSISTGSYKLSDFSLINVTKRDTLLIKSEFKGGVKSSDKYALNLYYTITEDNKSVLGFRKSDVFFKGYEWFINSKRDDQNKITFDKTLKNFDISNISIAQNNETLLLSGIIRDSTYKDIKLDFKDVELVKITPRIDSLSLAGRVNGQLQLLQNKGVYLPKSDIEIKNLNVNDFNLGNLKALVSGNNSLTNYDIDIELQNDNVKSFDAKGNVDLNKKNSRINVDVSFDDFLLDPLNPLGEGVISNIRGLVSGEAKVSGKLSKPDITGKLLLDRAGLAIPYLNVDYSFDFDSEVLLQKQQFIFNNVAMTDSEYFSRGFLNGYIEHNNFSDWKLGLDLTTDRLLVLSTEEKEDALYYGTAFISGNAQINGPTDQLVINVEGSTAPGTVFNIPLNDTESFGDNSFIKFLSPEEKAARAKGTVSSQTEVKGLELLFDLNVNQNAEIEIVIDKDSGSTIKGKGEGNLGFLINTNGKFNMWGDFVVFEGIYNFKYRGIVEKKFKVKEGGNIVWEGDPLNAQINLKALYETQANPSVLLDSPINQSIPVELEINLTGPLEQPNPDFTFNFPNVTSTIKSELDYRLSSKEDRDNQALYLLATGGFASGVNDLSFSGTIAERLNGIINGIFGDQNGDFKVGVDLELGQDRPDYETDDRFSVTLQTRISDRLLINGKVGVPFGSANETVIAGDVQIDWLLNDDGTLRAKVFNRENSIRNFGEEIGYTQGLGLSYNVEFDTFKELLQIIFSGKNRKLTKDDKATKTTTDSIDDNLPSFIKMKKN